MSITIDKWAFETAADAAGVEVYEDYSGRGMFGDTCPGVTYDAEGELSDFFIELADVTDADTARKLTARQRGDSMGRSAIAYFPGVELVD